MKKLDRLLKNSISDYIVIALGAALYAASVAVFTSKNNIAPGGLTGIATMLNYLFGLPIGAMIFIMNIPLFFWARVRVRLLVVFMIYRLLSKLIIIISGKTFFLPVCWDYYKIEKGQSQ